MIRCNQNHDLQSKPSKKLATIIQLIYFFVNNHYLRLLLPKPPTSSHNIYLYMLTSIALKSKCSFSSVSQISKVVKNIFYLNILYNS